MTLSNFKIVYHNNFNQSDFNILLSFSVVTAGDAMASLICTVLHYPRAGKLIARCVHDRRKFRSGKVAQKHDYAVN